MLVYKFYFASMCNRMTVPKLANIYNAKTNVTFSTLLRRLNPIEISEILNRVREGLPLVVATRFCIRLISLESRSTLNPPFQLCKCMRVSSLLSLYSAQLMVHITPLAGLFNHEPS